ncbi:Na+/H+ antiporter subunit E [Roseococcus pinisoli]|uniref:Na+/H+ antiporter subunit E n=1 Tax=Roseococcus pinisoli TaxID=2835040 RepID=A0ABS5QH45_9PROT|nr:Na+/H+ antiporter subunit E [Roseococcus pinisoli]MBS7813000.1 Na+/H+ antiporter subunit E [Roseococcus pinisoli]
MRWLLPHPLVSLGLLVLWLLLNRTYAPGPALVGIIVALMGGWALALLDPGRPRLRRLDVVLKLTLHVLLDIAKSNLAVARNILERKSDRRAGFLRIQLELREPQALAVLACIVTATPGSAWVEFDPEDGQLLLHVLDVGEEADWVRLIKERYEQPLMEIFA